MRRSHWSASSWAASPTGRRCARPAETLTRFGVAHEAKVVSAHRTPAWMVEYASGAEARGLEVIIAGAGGAAHLPGMVAANTLLPVLGVPVESHALKGMDSLLSIVQMPGRHSGGHVGHRQGGRAERGAAGGGDSGESRSGAAREAARVSRGTGQPSPLGRTGVTKPILPGATIGVLGSGQLGRMFAIAARRMGYRVHTLSPDEDTPTGQVADLEVQASYDDLDAVSDFARHVSVVTFEFENVPAPTAEAAARCAPVRPSGSVLHTTQQRIREKSFLTKAGLPTTPYREVHSLEGLKRALADLGCPAVLKTAAFGYDGKGQFRVDAPEQRGRGLGARSAKQQAVLEAFIDFDREISVVAARGEDGEFVHYGAIENQHQPAYSGRVDRTGARVAAGRARRRWSWRAACSKNWTWSACCASSFS